jgi:Mg2+ and Co2+ transporter CorA
MPNYYNVCLRYINSSKVENYLRNWKNTMKVEAMNDVVGVVSIISSVFSIILAIFAIMFSRRVEERLKKNFLRLKEIMELNHDRTKEVLENVDQEADAIKATVYDSQTELRETLEQIMDECNLSEKK